MKCSTRNSSSTPRTVSTQRQRVVVYLTAEELQGVQRLAKHVNLDVPNLVKYALRVSGVAEGAHQRRVGAQGDAVRMRWPAYRGGRGRTNPKWTKPVEVDGFRFASEAESQRYTALKERTPGLHAGASPDGTRLYCCAPSAPARVIETFTLRPAGPNKFGAKKVFYDGRWFDSGLECRWYVVLKAMEAAGEIRDLQTQVKYEFVINDRRAGSYRADFEYLVVTGPGAGEKVTADAKSDATRKETDYQMRKRLMWACHSIPLTELS